MIPGPARPLAPGQGPIRVRRPGGLPHAGHACTNPQGLPCKERPIRDPGNSRAGTRCARLLAGNRASPGLRSE